MLISLGAALSALPDAALGGSDAAHDTTLEADAASCVEKEARTRGGGGKTPGGGTALLDSICSLLLVRKSCRDQLIDHRKHLLSFGYW